MNEAETHARIFSDTSAYAHREYRSISVYTYNLVPSGRTKCTVSACRRAPGARASGLGVASCGRFQGLRFLMSPCRFRVRLTEDRLTTSPCLSSDWCTTSAHRFRSFRFATMATTKRGHRPPLGKTDAAVPSLFQENRGSQFVFRASRKKKVRQPLKTSAAAPAGSCRMGRAG